MPLDLNQLRDLLTALNQTDITELTLKSDDFELTVRRAGPGSEVGSSISPEVPRTAALGVAGGHPVVVPSLPAPLPAQPGLEAGSRSGTSESIPTSGGTVPPPTNDRRTVEVKSPMVGTFYRAPAPDEAPFVEVGDRIRVGQTVCIIEAMKLMNELESEVVGEVVEILVQNGEPVEYGQVLMRVNPS